MPSAVLDRRDFEHDLARAGVVRENGGALICQTLDGALEWIEERILEDAGQPKKSEDRLLDVKDIDLFREFDEATLARLAACMRERFVPQGENVFSHGDPGDEIFLVRRGRVQALLPLEGGKRHHLATFGRGDFFGELAFLDRGIRSADAEAKDPTDLYVLSRARFDVEARASDAEFAVKVFARLARAIADRLRQADAELQALEER
jgi:SulP family sulfate permease